MFGWYFALHAIPHRDSPAVLETRTIYGPKCAIKNNKIKSKNDKNNPTNKFKTTKTISKQQKQAKNDKNKPKTTKQAQK